MDELLIAAFPEIVELTGRQMSVATDTGARRVEKHFQTEVVRPALWETIERLVRTADPDDLPRDLPSRAMVIDGFRHEGRMPGAVDVVLGRAGDGLPSGVELKWCWEATTFGNCLWDILKLATAENERRLAAGYLLVGGASSAFAQESPGNEAFMGLQGLSWEIDTETLLTAARYRAWWRRWRADVIARPRVIPKAVGTRLLARAHIGGLSVALARVLVVDPGLREVDPDGAPISGLSGGG